MDAAVNGARVLSLAVIAGVSLVMASCGGLVFDDSDWSGSLDGSLRPGIYCDERLGVIHPDGGLGYYSRMQLCQGKMRCTSLQNGGDPNAMGYYCGTSDGTPHPHCIKPCETNGFCYTCTRDDAGCPDVCKGGCTNFLNDAWNCGTCGHSCGGGQQCAQGVCTP